MFGRRVTPPARPASPAAGSDFPIEPFRDALMQAARRLSAALEQAGVSCGGLHDGVPATADLPDALTGAMRFESTAGPKFFAFGYTLDFKTVDFEPNLRVFLITNILNLIADYERLRMPGGDAVVQSMGPSALLDARLMHAWLAYPLAVSAAMKDGPEALARIVQQIRHDLHRVAGQASPRLLEMGGIEQRIRTWSSFPAVIAHQWSDKNVGLNGMPQTPEHQDELVKWLAAQQAQGLSQRAA